MKKFSPLILVLWLCSCTVQQRFDRLIRRHPELLNVTDTITVKDTFFIKSHSLDTVFSQKFDTVNIFTVDSFIKVRFIKKGDSIRATITQKADTIYKTKQVAFKRVVCTPVLTKWYGCPWFWAFACCLISLILLLRAWLR